MARLSTPTGVELALLTIDDVAAAAELSAAIGWNQDEQDWRRLIDLHPSTVIGAWRNGRLVGSATLAVYPPDLAWLGMVITHPDARGQGIGGAVVDAVLATPEAASVPLIGLDATPAGAPIYERRGFVTVDTVERWEGALVVGGGADPETGGASRAAGSAAGSADEAAAGRRAGGADTSARATIRPLVPRDAASVVEFDRDAAGVDRGRMLTHLLGEPGVRAWVAQDDERTVGYAVRRPGRTHVHVGPVVADDDAVFGALLSSAMFAETPGPVFVDAVHRDGVAKRLDAAGFAVARTLGRMTRGSGGAALTGERLKAAMALEWG